MVLTVLFSLFAFSIVVSSIIYGITPMPSNQKASQKILEIIQKTPSQKIVDLGSGWGNLAHKIVKKTPDTHVTGYEASWIPWAFSLFFKNKRLRFFRQNFFMAPLGEFEVVVCYLYPGAMKKLKPKFESELKKNTLVISNTFQIPGWEPQEVHPVKDFYRSSIYVYHR